MKCLTLLLALMLLASEVSFALDKELTQSAKCVNFFRYYESLLRIPKDALYSISINETGKLHKEKKTKMAWPWAANVGGQSFYFDTKREAVDFVKKQISEGKENIDVGCMQVNLKYHPDAFKSIEEAFNPQTNIKYAANFLVSKFIDLGTWGEAISHYHSATPHLGAKYKENVIRIAKNIDFYKSAFKVDRSKNQYNINIKRQSDRYAYVKSIERPKINIVPISKVKRYRSEIMILPKNNALNKSTL